MFTVLGVTTSNAQAKSTAKVAKIDGAGMAFQTDVIDYGNIAHNSDGKREFVFTNNGTKPLIITNTQGSCGCTVPEYPRTPIKPGESGEMKVTFSSAGRNGMQSKTVDITTNTAEGHQQLLIKASIK